MMGVRREKPPAERAGDSIRFRFPDGTTRTVPVDELRGPVGADICCFCGQSVEHSDAQWIQVTAQWSDSGETRAQSWGAHRKCLAERMHERVAGTGLFFGD